MDNVVWKQIDNFPYEVSNLGDVRRCSNTSKYSNSYAGKVLKPWYSRGYHVVDLMKDGIRHTVYVHKLVIETFVGSRPNGLDIHHIDGNKLNNRVSNLSYVTRLINSNATSNHHGPVSKFSSKDISIIKFLSSTITGRELAKRYNCSEATISRIKNQ